jgi:hypothetical protein
MVHVPLTGPYFRVLIDGASSRRISMRGSDGCSTTRKEMDMAGGLCCGEMREGRSE